MVAVLEKVNRFRVSNLSAFGKCDLFHHGIVQDSIFSFNQEFIGSTVYGIIDEFGNGAAALSCALAGKLDEVKGDIYINECKIINKDIQKFSCYVGDDSGLKKQFGLKSMTVREQIEYGINKNLSFSNDIAEIQRNFGLSEERFDRVLKYCSGERWRASMAIGYAQGKSIYCFPWMNTKDLLNLENQIRLGIKLLLEIGAILIIPTVNEKTLINIYDSCNIISL